MPAMFNFDWRILNISGTVCKMRLNATDEIALVEVAWTRPKRISVVRLHTTVKGIGFIALGEIKGPKAALSGFQGPYYASYRFADAGNRRHCFQYNDFQKSSSILRHMSYNLFSEFDVHIIGQNSTKNS